MLQPFVNWCAVPQVVYNYWTEKKNNNSIISQIPKGRVTVQTGARVRSQSSPRGFCSEKKKVSLA